MAAVLRSSSSGVSSRLAPASRSATLRTGFASSTASARNHFESTISTSRSLRLYAERPRKPRRNPWASRVTSAPWAFAASRRPSKSASPSSSGGSATSLPMMAGHQNLTVASAKRSSATIRRASHCTLLSEFGASSPAKPGSRMSRYQVSPSLYTLAPTASLANPPSGYCSYCSAQATISMW